jgi:5-oxoprolinase (ATP-hydrolysing)
MYSGGLARGGAGGARGPAPGDVIAGPGHHRGEERDHGGGAGLGSAHHRLDHIVLDRRVPRAVKFAAGTQVDPVLLEVFNNLFMNIAEQMGLQLQNTAYSVNIKERLDFSCALFDAEGNLIANAPHMPVHLGSMGESIKTVIRENRADGAGRRVCAERSVPRRHAPAGRDGDHAGVPGAIDPLPPRPDVLRRLPRSPRRHRRHHARLHAALLDPHRGRGRADQQLQAGRPRHLREQEMLALLRSGKHPSRNPSRTWAT